MLYVLIKVENAPGEWVWNVSSSHSSMEEAQAAVAQLKAIGTQESHIFITTQVP